MWVSLFGGGAALRTVRRCAPRLRALSVKAPSESSLFVRNLGDATGDELRKEISAAGLSVGKVTAPINLATGRGRGFALLRRNCC